MKQLYILIFIILLVPEASSQWIDIKQLSNMGIDINQYLPQELLGLGIGNCDLELIKSAIVKGAELNKQLEVGLGGISIFPLCKAIHWAADALLPGDESKLVNYIRDGGTDVYSGRSVSDLRRDYIEIIKFLLQKGAKATVSSDFNSDNIPLLLAAGYRDIEVIKLLLDFKADPNSKDQTGSTALHILGYPSPFSWPFRIAPEIAKLLISKGAKMIPEDHDKTPLVSTKETLRTIEYSSSPWKDYPFYNELINSLKSLIDIYSKM